MAGERWDMISRMPFGRTVTMFLIWMLIANHDADDIAVGCVVAALAAWASLRLLPPGELRPRPLAALRLAARTLAQAFVAGADVASRAFRADMPLRPGIARYRTTLPEGARRHAFGSLISLCPGTLPLSVDGSGVQLVHCLDTAQDIPTTMMREEEDFRRAFPGR
jgi:multicomponent Na+:H+ antiporter subunit E